MITDRIKKISFKVIIWRSEKIEQIEPIILAWNVPVARAKVPRIIDRIPVVKTAKRFDYYTERQLFHHLLGQFPRKWLGHRHVKVGLNFANKKFTD